jgi:hydrogenase maturation factor
MCIARVGKVVSRSSGFAEVKYLDGQSGEGIDVSLVGAQKGDYIEVFAGLGLSILTSEDVTSRKALWREVHRGEARARA